MQTKGLTAKEVIEVLTRYEELDGELTLGDDPMWYNSNGASRTRHTSINRDLHVRAIFIEGKLEAIFKTNN
ncbi:hypothetical protein VPHK469_0112 [Vibrio phage K469]